MVFHLGGVYLRVYLDHELNIKRILSNASKITLDEYKGNFSGKCIRGYHVVELNGKRVELLMFPLPRIVREVKKVAHITQEATPSPVIIIVLLTLLIIIILALALRRR